MYLDEHKLLWISSLIALLQWTLVNIGEHWWTLVNIGEHWWTLVSIGEHWWTLWTMATIGDSPSSNCPSPVSFVTSRNIITVLILILIYILPPMSSLRWTFASICSSASLNSRIAHTHTEYSLLIQSQDEYHQNGSRQAQFDYLTQQPWIGQVSDVFPYKTWRQIFVPILHPNWRLGQRRRKNSKEIQQRLRRNSFCGDEGKVNIFDLKVIVISLPRSNISTHQIDLILRSHFTQTHCYSVTKDAEIRQWKETL